MVVLSLMNCFGLSRQYATDWVSDYRAGICKDYLREEIGRAIKWNRNRLWLDRMVRQAIG